MSSVLPAVGAQDPTAGISPRQRDCLRLVWQQRATSKEIAAQLGISKSTVDGYIAEAVATLGARDRRAAAAVLFGETPPVESGGHSTRVSPAAELEPSPVQSTDAVPTLRPWRSRPGQLNSLTLAQTLGWIAIIALGSLAALALAMAIGNGIPPVARPLLNAFDRLTH